MIQGDVSDDVIDFIQGKWPEVSLTPILLIIAKREARHYYLVLGHVNLFNVYNGCGWAPPRGHLGTLKTIKNKTMRLPGRAWPSQLVLQTSSFCGAEIGLGTEARWQHSDQQRS